MSTAFNVDNPVIVTQSVSSPGTAQQIAAHNVPDGIPVIVTARPSNAGSMYVAFSAAAAQSSTGAREEFSRGRSAEYWIDRTDLLFVDADNSTDVLEIRIPKYGKGA